MLKNKLTDTDIYFLCGTEPFDSEYRKMFGFKPDSQKRFLIDRYGYKKGYSRFVSRVHQVYDAINEQRREQDKLSRECPFGKVEDYI